MKLFFKFFYIFIFFLLSFNVSAQNLEEVYKVEVGGIDIGTLKWSLKIDGNNYNVLINLKDRGIFSGFYKFNGKYGVSGKIINGEVLPDTYKQAWKTKKKNRDVEIKFDNLTLVSLKLKPEEKEVARKKYLGVLNYYDPLSSFLNILAGSEKSKTIDGRRMYSMVVESTNNVNDLEIKKIVIVDYENIWADHKRNDLKYIEIYQQNSDICCNVYVLPMYLKIKFKGLVFKLTKI